MSVLFLIGKTLGKYQIVEHIGHGGMAEVYKARHVQLDRMVAIKVLHPFLADESGFVARFRREAKIVATLRHQNIVRVYDFDHDEDLDIYYMVMEYIEGESLKKRLEGGPLPIGEALSITAAIADALDYAHQRGMVHRDIKPANILFTTENVPVLTDFGIARMLSVTGLTASGAMVGTPAYMAPEVGMGDAGSVASDVYSLGVVLFEMLTGRPPFVAETPMGVIMQHINEPAPTLSQFIINPMPALESVVQRCLAKKPEERYASAQELAQHLRTLLGNSGAFGTGVTLPDGVVFVEDWARVTSPPPATTTSPSTLRITPAPAPAAPSTEEPPSESPVENATTTAPVRSLEVVEEAEQAVAEAVAPVPARPKRRWGWLIGLFLALSALGGGLGWAWQSGRLNAWLGGAPLPFNTPSSPAAEPLITPSPTPTVEITAEGTPAPCRYRISIEKVELRPAAQVPPQAPLSAVIALHNAGTCALPEGGRLIVNATAQDPQAQVFNIPALTSGGYYHAIVTLPTPAEGGAFTRTVRAIWSQPLGLQEVYTFTYQVDPALTPTPFAPLVPTPTPATAQPLVARSPILIAWREDLTQGVWYGTLRLQASGGSGVYQFFYATAEGEVALSGAELTFAWRRCEDFPLSLRILSGYEEVFWDGSIAYPLASTCQP